MATSQYTHTVTQASVPVDGALVWVTTDLAGTNVVVSGNTDTFGAVTFTLDEGAYYVWCQHSGTNFANPTAETVTAPADTGTTDGTAAAGSGDATLAALKAAIGNFQPGDTSDDALLQDLLDAAQDWIESPEGTGRRFGVGVQGVRYFYPSEVNSLDIDDAANVTEVAIDYHGDHTYSQIVPAKEYELLPLNIGTPLVRGQASRLRLLPYATNVFVLGYRVRVTATWAYGTIPVGVKLAKIRIAQRAFKLLREAPLGVVQAPELGTIARVGAEDSQVRAWLAPYVQQAASSRAWVLV